MNERRPLMYGAGWWCAMTVCVLLVGCRRPPQVGGQNRKLVESLKTAVMAGNSVWLEENAKLVESRRQEGQLTDDEYAEFTAIIGAARANNWPGARDQVMRWAKAQQPTAEETAPAKIPKGRAVP